jgi:hypothetical protein
LSEASRVLRPGGLLAIFDGDYVTATVGLSDHDPLQACVDMMMQNAVNDRYIVRRMPALARAAGFEVQAVGSHGLIESDRPGYMLTVIDRGADMLFTSGVIGEPMATALKDEARRRVEAGTFFGHVAYGSVIASKP